MRGIEKAGTFGRVYFDAAVGALQASLLNEGADGKAAGFMRGQAKILLPSFAAGVVEMGVKLELCE